MRTVRRPCPPGGWTPHSRAPTRESPRSVFSPARSGEHGPRARTAGPRCRRGHPAGDARRSAHGPGHAATRPQRSTAAPMTWTPRNTPSGTRTGRSPRRTSGPSSHPATVRAPCGCCCSPSWWSTSPTGCSPPATACPGAPGRTGCWCGSLALSLTVLLVAAACEVALDLTAWQCAGSPGCSGGRSWLGFLSASHGGWWAQPGRRLGRRRAGTRRSDRAAVVPLQPHLECLRVPAAAERRVLRPKRPSRPTAPHWAAPDSGTGAGSSRRLRAAHTAAGFLTVAAALTLAAGAFDRRASGTRLEASGRAAGG